MANNERKLTWPQIRDALGVDEDRLLSAWLTGSFVNPTKEVTQEIDVDVILAFESFDAMDEFEYDRRYPESDYDDGESELLYCRTSEVYE